MLPSLEGLYKSFVKVYILIFYVFLRFLFIAFFAWLEPESLIGTIFSADYFGSSEWLGLPSL